MPIPSSQQFEKYQLDRVPVSQPTAAASQAAVALKTFNNNLGMVALGSGTIAGVTIYTSNPKSAGTLTVTPTINGTVIVAPPELINVALGTASTAAVVSRDGLAGTRFVAGDIIGAKVTTSAAFATSPVNGDLQVFIYVIYDTVNP